MRPALALLWLWAAAACVHSLEEAAPPEECASLAMQRVNPKALARIHASPFRTAELAVSHCAMKLTWLPRVLDAVQAEHLQLVRVSIYLKCGPGAFSLPDAERAMPLGGELIVDTLANVGRCDHVWAHHLWLRWNTLADVVLFLKDTTFSNPSAELARLTLSPHTVISDAMHLGFGCFRKPTHGGLAGRLHLRKRLVKFRRSEYRGATKAYRNWLPGAKGSPHFRAKWNMTEFVARAFDPWFFKLFTASTFIPVCYGGAFAFLGASAKMHSRKGFGRLRNMLARADNLEEGHFQERLWMYVLFPEPPLTLEESVTLARTVNGFAAQPSYVGMVTHVAGACHNATTTSSPKVEARQQHVNRTAKAKRSR